MTPLSSRVLHNKIASVLPERFDVFICCASFEERSTSVPLSINPQSCDRPIIFFNEDVQGDGIENANKIARHFGPRAETSAISKKNPVVTADEFIDHIQASYNEVTPPILVVDISCFTHETLLILQKVLSIILPVGAEVIYAYTPAKEYDPGTPDDSKWLSRGLGSVRSVLGYSGLWAPSKKVHLVVLVGFESDRAMRLIESYEPDALSLGVGSIGPVDASIDDVRKLFYQEIARAFPRYTDFGFPPLDPLGVKDALLKHVEKFPEYNTVICPMNTKLSTIGAALAAFERETLQLAYGSAGSYNWQNYSSPCDYSIIFTIPDFPVSSA